MPDKLVLYLVGKEGSKFECESPNDTLQPKSKEASATIQAINEQKSEEGLDKIARELEGHMHKKLRASTCEARDAETHPLAVQAKARILQEFSETSMSGVYPRDPPVRGPFGAAEIWLKPDAVPVAQHPYRIGGGARSSLARASGRSNGTTQVATFNRCLEPTYFSSGKEDARKV